MLEIDGSQHAGSGTIVRQAVALAAVTGRPLRITRARARRRPPGLRPQHVQVIKAVCALVQGRAEGLVPGSQEIVFHPGPGRAPAERYDWDIGSAGSTTMLALAVLPVLAFAPRPVEITLRGGVFQDFAPSSYHLQHVMGPLLERFGLRVDVRLRRPGYVPRGQGILELTVAPVQGALRPVVLDRPAPVERIWGLALASHLTERRVAQRMAAAAEAALAERGREAAIDCLEDAEAVQPGAAFALFADLRGSAGRLGADWAGARGRSAETIGRQVVRWLEEDLESGATLDRWAADQVIPFAALAAGLSRFRIPRPMEHVTTNAWLVERCLEARVEVGERELTVVGSGIERRPAVRPGSEGRI